MLKGHSSGVGDLLRSSAAWRALRNHFPAAHLHLWFLTRGHGKSSEELIARHHLLASFRVSDKRTHGLAGWKRLLSEGRQVGQQTRPDLIIDFEPSGVRTSLLARWVAFWTHAPTVGIAQELLRGCFYTRSAPSTRAYARRHGFSLPMEYTERDFVVLAALVGELQHRHGFALALTGAPFEQDNNRQFLSRFQARGPVVDLAGRTSLLELAGVINACNLFVSSDSGPYHMSVALRMPTLALFVVPNPQHYHFNPWTHCLVAPSLQSLPEALEAAEQLLRVTPAPLPKP